MYLFSLCTEDINMYFNTSSTICGMKDMRPQNHIYESPARQNSFPRIDNSQCNRIISFLSHVCSLVGDGYVGK